MVLQSEPWPGVAQQLPGNAHSVPTKTRPERVPGGRYETPTSRPTPVLPRVPWVRGWDLNLESRTPAAGLLHRRWPMSSPEAAISRSRQRSDSRLTRGSTVCFRHISRFSGDKGFRPNPLWHKTFGPLLVVSASHRFSTFRTLSRPMRALDVDAPPQRLPNGSVRRQPRSLPKPPL